MRVLVTGGAGYIGSHAAKVLANSGFEPIVLDNLSTGHRWAVKWGPLIHGDLANGSLIRHVMATYKVQAVMHFAANAYVDESVKSPRKYFRNNVANTLNLLDAMIDLEVPHLVFSSTCATYGAPEKIPISEGQNQHPVNPYGESKRTIERALHWYGRAYRLSWVALRYFNAAGADRDAEIGEEHHPETHLIPVTIQAALGRRTCLQVYGTDYPTPDGTAVRDYVHVTDLAVAHLLALQHLLAGGQSTALNLGTGKGHSVREVILAVERVAGRAIPVREAVRRAGDPPALVADAAKATQLLGWRPRYSDLDTIVQTAWRWHSARAAKARLLSPAAAS